LYLRFSPEQILLNVISELLKLIHASLSKPIFEAIFFQILPTTLSGIISWVKDSE
jgi:hypothetical protein